MFQEGGSKSMTILPMTVINSTVKVVVGNFWRDNCGTELQNCSHQEGLLPLYISH